jgi:hypothetical protein
LENEIKFPGVLNELTAVHVRRGDYGHHGLLPFKYYVDALNELGRPDFVVFSDEYNLAEYYFGRLPGFKYVVKPNLGDPAMDFCSMLAYKNYIIANSSYSWMAAFLHYKKFKRSTVLYPSIWSAFGGFPGAPTGWRKIETQLQTF